MKHLTPFIRKMFLLIAGILLPVAGVYAQSARDACSPNRTDQIPLEVTVNMGRDAQYKELIGPWFTSPSVIWTCKRVASPIFYVPANDRRAVKVRTYLGNVKKAGSVQVDGESYTVYTRGNQDSIGFIIRVQHHLVGHASTEFMPLDIDSGAYTPWKVLESPARRANGDTFEFSTTVQVRLVKLTDKTVPVTDFPFARVEFVTRKFSGGGWHWQPADYNASTYRLKANIANVKAACTTRNVPVDLGTAHSGNLKQPGDHGPVKEFNLLFEKCPEYMHSIAYRFTPLPAGASVSNGILPLDAQSTASGVGVQVLNADGSTPLAFNNTFIPLSVYDPFNPLPVYEVPLKARIIRTSGALIGGSVHAAMRMVVRYK